MWCRVFDYDQCRGPTFWRAYACLRQRRRCFLSFFAARPVPLLGLPSTLAVLRQGSHGRDLGGAVHQFGVLRCIHGKGKRGTRTARRVWYSGKLRTKLRTKPCCWFARTMFRTRGEHLAEDYVLPSCFLSMFMRRVARWRGPPVLDQHASHPQNQLWRTLTCLRAPHTIFRSPPSPPPL